MKSKSYKEDAVQLRPWGYNLGAVIVPPFLVSNSLEPKSMHEGPYCHRDRN